MAWDLVVTVNSVDISTQLVDVAPIVIEAERSAARIAEFTVLLSGVVDPNSWTGKTVTIDHVDGATTRLFTGVVSDPVLDITNKTLRVLCTDDLQRIIDGKTLAELLTLTGGYWSDYVFNTESTGWEKLQDILSTIDKSVELSAAGVLECHSWQNTVSPDYTFDEDTIADESLRVELVKRSNLINTVNIDFSARFERLYQREQMFDWTFSQTVCDGINKQLVLPTKTMISEAITGAGWQILNILYTDSWAPGAYTCGGLPAVYNNLTPELFAIEFEAECAFRWAQSVTDAYTFKVYAPDSVAEFGELVQEIGTSFDIQNPIENWGDQETDFADTPVGMIYDGNGNLYIDQFDASGFQTAFNTLVATAAERINSSHRSNSVSFALPINPVLQLQHTVKIDDVNLQAKGVVKRLRHSFNMRSAEALTEVELAVSSGQSGLDTVTQTWTAPTHSGPSGGGAPTVIFVPTYVGGDFGSVAEDPSWWGYFCNANFFFGEIPDPPTPTYSQRFEIKFDAFPATWTDNTVNPVSISDIAIDVSHNLLTITA